MHTYKAYVLNPNWEEHALDRPERQLGELWLRADYNGIAHFETIGKTVLNSLCVDVGNVKVFKNLDSNSQDEKEAVGPSLVIPVKSVRTVLAA